MITMRKKNGISLTDQKQELGLFLNWFIKHYSTSSNAGLMFYMDSMENEVSIKQIVDAYLVKIHANKLTKPVKNLGHIREKSE